MDFKKILIATDLSEHSIATARFAARLFETGHHFTVVTAVSDPFISMEPHSSPRSPALEEFRKGAMEEAGSLLAAFCDAHFSGQCERQEAIPCADSPARAICDFARREGYDLLVIGSHGAGRLDSLFLGTTAQRVIALSPCPVLAIPEKAIHDLPQERRGIHKILAATDRSDAALKVMESLAARLTDADEVLIVSVLGFPGMLDWQREFMKRLTPLSEYVEDRAPRAKRQLEEIASRFSAAARVTTSLVESQKNAAELICEEGEKYQADCIAMGSAGAGVIGNLFLGSTVQAVLKTAECPVLIFPREQKA